MDASIRTDAEQPQQNPVKTESPKEIWTPRETALYLRLQLSTIYKMVHDGRIPFIKKFGRLRFRKSDIDRWLKAR